MKKTWKAAAVIICAAVVMCSCSKGVQTENEITTASAADANTDLPGIDEIINEDNMFTERDLDFSYDSREPADITLSDSGSQSKSDKVSISESIVTITSSGVYVLSGSLSDGQIIVDAGSTDKVQLVLNGVNINCDDSAAVYVKEADKVFITSIGDNNILSNKNDFVQTTDDNVNSVIFSKSNLTMNGSGSLTVTAAYGHGISSKKDLKLTGGEYTVTAAKHSLDATDSIRVTDCTLLLNAQKDALHASNSDESDKGYVYIRDGTLDINCGDDGIHAISALKISGGKININKCYEGLEGRLINISSGDIAVTSEDDGINASSGSSDTSDTADTAQNAGGRGFNSFQAGCGIDISGGTLYINAGGDGIDSNGYINISGGEISVYGAENDGNSAIDSETGISASGGKVIALGMSGMAESFSEDSQQCSILYNIDSTKGSGAQILLTDSDGVEIISAKAVKSFNSVIISTPDITDSGKYTLSIDGEEYEIEMTSAVYSNGAGGGMGMRGGRGGFADGGNMQNMPDGNNVPGGTAPQGEMPDGNTPPDAREDMSRNDGSAPPMPQNDNTNTQQ